MTQKQAARARRIISSPFYNRYRKWMMHRMCKRYNRCVMRVSRSELLACSKLLIRYAVREAWYIERMRK